MPNTMYTLAEPPSRANREELYRHLFEQAQLLLGEERDVIANTANLSSLIFHTLPDVNWAGFYFLREGELVLGPFQGKPACIRIAVDRGVCGTAAARRETVIVADVDEFPGHITCDSASQSEIVVPIVRGGELLGVLDIDSPHTGRFDDDDRRGLERVVSLL